MGNLSLDQVVVSQNNKETTINNAAAELESAMTELFLKSLTALTSPITLSTTEWLRAVRVDFTGTLTGNFTAHAPAAVKKLAIVTNLTTGGFDVTLDISGGTSVLLHPGQQKLVYADGTNVVLVQDLSQKIGAFVPGLPGDGAKVLAFLSPFDFKMKTGLGGARVTVGVNPTATAVFTIKKGVTSIGTISISTIGVPTIAFASDISFSDNTDILSIVAPSPQDTTLADVSIILPIQRST